MLINTNIVDLFQASSSTSPSSSSLHQENNKIKNTNINQQIFKNVIDNDIESISGDSDDEITVNQCSKITINNDILYEVISDDENELNEALPFNNNNDALYEPISDDDDYESNMMLQVNNDELNVNNHSMVDDDKSNEQCAPVKHKSYHHSRSIEARRRSRKRNNVFRRRFQYVMTRPVYPRFTMKSIRKILRRYDISYIHIKIEQELLIIGAKNNKIKDQNKLKLPINTFCRHNYYAFRRLSQV
ncbi:unnamed protein product [Rotaria sp. Silwood1]|nr:unnamed protein product [Rotaria sp. Silwood1]CAF3789832.1 unnamed protein product [Rotaria sp. Silwood1]CAF3846288.1 unnamed protein product [Rotaria sp. Silwood1]CAF3872691.1 unnamed protein product [Rotaria sp. Silwood1]CAF3938264.1 unnamed protein product [Rotaria sp. Silwood1]